MDIVLIFNGLGNQMSQYAFYYAKKKRHPFATSFITSRYDKYKAHNGYELERLFGIRDCRLKDRLLYHIYRSLFMPLFGHRIMTHLTHEIRESANYDFEEKLLEPAKSFGFNFYWGGWHSEKYFADYRKELRDNVFHFDESMLNDGSRKWKECIDRDECSCSLHIRRGDFLKDRKWADAITPDYYDNAIAYMKESLGKAPFFYVFSNDIEWCREKFGDDGFHYVDCNGGLDSWQDMYLMSRCRHHINANSSFSWWGAWLTPHEEGITVCPKAFVSTMETKDVYPESWIKM